MHKENVTMRKVLHVPIEKVLIHPSSPRDINSEKNQEYVEFLIQRYNQGYDLEAIEVYPNSTGEFIIVDGNLIREASFRLNLHTIPVFVTKELPETVEEYLDIVLVKNFRSQYSIEEKCCLLKNISRIGSNYSSNLSSGQINIIFSNILGKGFKRNNVITLRKIFQHEYENPDNLGLSTDIISGKISVDEGRKVLQILTEKRFDYSIEKEKKSNLYSAIKEGRTSADKVQKMLLKLKDPTKLTNYVLNKNIDKNGWMVKFCDSRNMKFEHGTKLNGSFSSIPYFQQIKTYCGAEDRNNNEIGWEETAQQFAENIASVYKNTYNDFTEDAVIGINISDTYKNGVSQGIYYHIGMAMIKAGFFPIGQTIWYKKDAKPVNLKMKRNRDNYEMVLLFSKTEKYYFEKLKFNNPNKKKEIKGNCGEQGTKGKRGFHVSGDYDTIDNFMDVQRFSDIVELNQSTGRSKMEFHGDFSFLLPISFILQYIPENGVIWDPFAGTGTVGRSALLLNRKVILTELYEHNYELIKNNIEKGISDYNPEELIKLNKTYVEETYFSKEINGLLSSPKLSPFQVN